MSLGKTRRTWVALMAALLVIGLATHGLGGPDIVLKSAMAAADEISMPGDMPMSSEAPMPGKCSGCAGHERGVMAAACAAFCGAAVTIPSAAVVLYAVPVKILRPTTARIGISRNEPPDPYPPRTIVLS